MEFAPVALQRKRQKSCIDSIRVEVIARLSLFRGVHRGPGSRAEGSADAGRQLLPVRAAVRSRLGKQAGDLVRARLSVGGDQR